MTSSLVFDKKLLKRRKARAAKKCQSFDFMLERVAEDFALRLGGIQRDFQHAVNLGAYHGKLSTLLAGLPNIGQIINAESCLQLLAQCPAPRVLCDEEILPFADASLDLVFSGLALQHINDLPGALIQIRRALKPDGVFLAALLGGRTLHELREVLMLAEEELEGGVSPRVAPFADIRDYGALLQRAGFALPVSDVDVFTVTYEHPLKLMHDLRGMGASNSLIARNKKPLRRETLFRAMALYMEKYAGDDGRIPATFEIVHLIGWAPDASQPKPLAPGSAKTRLADALGVQENSVFGGCTLPSFPSPPTKPKA